MTTFPSSLRLNGLVRTGPVDICPRDVRLILAMIDAGLKDQQIHAFFSQPGRDFNHNKISALRSANRSTQPPPATRAQLQAFLDSWCICPPFSHFWGCHGDQGLDEDAWQVAYGLWLKMGDGA